MGANSSRDPPPSSYHPAQPSSSSTQMQRPLPSPSVQISPFLLPYNMRPTPTLHLLPMGL
ncbi:hypothetical protein FRC02_005368 [Tulasnella sp. 418]|nr:hypothetical protein FRC02_005368 [Tulasnella sp. 418]